MAVKFLERTCGELDYYNWYAVDGVTYGISYDAKNDCIKPNSLMDEEGGLIEFSYHPDAREIFDKIIEFNARETEGDRIMLMNPSTGSVGSISDWLMVVTVLDRR
tara:strand:+ start:651 stop:965 length:315 start_codon:yes stop_codon:yes gene_type:complete